MDALINGAHLNYLREGAGRAVLLLHAGIADSRMWQPQAAELSKHFDVIRVDQRGFGDSDLPQVPYSMVADVIALLDHLDVERAHVVGCSMGGTLALDLTIEHPERVAKLVLVAAGVGGANLGAADAALFAEVEAADQRGDLEAVNRAEVRLWVDGPRRAEGSAPRAVRELVLEMNGRALRSNFDGAVNQRLDPPAVGRLREIKVPTLVIVGEEDLPHASANAELITSRVAGARSVVIKDAAHLPSLEHPEEFNRIVLDFLLGD